MVREADDRRPGIQNRVIAAPAPSPKTPTSAPSTRATPPQPAHNARLARVLQHRAQGQLHPCRAARHTHARQGGLRKPRAEVRKYLVGDTEISRAGVARLDSRDRIGLHKSDQVRASFRCSPAHAWIFGLLWPTLARLSVPAPHRRHATGGMVSGGRRQPLCCCSWRCCRAQCRHLFEPRSIQTL